MDKILVLDFGGQYKELIARRVRELGVYSEIKPCTISAEQIMQISPKGIILTGGPNSVYAENSPKADEKLFSLGIPVLGICYGMQYVAATLGGKVTSCKVSEYGKTLITKTAESILFEGLPEKHRALMSHTDRVCKMPEGYTLTSRTKNCAIAAFENVQKMIYAVQFHPEVELSECGKQVLKNFVFGVCGAVADYSITDYLEKQIKLVREQVQGGKIVLGLSGGVDSSVAAALLSRAIGKRLTCVFVDHGLMRKNEGDAIEAAFAKFDLNFVRVNASDRFLQKLKGVTEPEKKRKIIGSEFVRVFEEQAKKVGADYLGQGTIYPDVIESGAINSAVIKSHHNVGGLPADMGFKGLIEPLRGLFKDEVRILGRTLGLPEGLVMRQPFPGPGLGVRVIGEITEQKLSILKEADAIFCEELEKHKIKANQYFAVLTDMRTVGVMGDFRTYDYVVALRAVTTTDFMTAEYVPLPHKLLGKISLRIANEVEGASRVVYDITGKPPATIEWE